jgi:glycosyltransferase involved in cell wall biosynthesis
MVLPKVSCYCATFGRPWALEEAIESFLRQDYPGEKELIILNDYSGHRLLLDDNSQNCGVAIHNVDTHIIPLGLKFNSTIDLCSGDVLMPWEDDDIYLPNRISYTIAHMHNDFFHTRRAFIEHHSNRLAFSENYFHCNLAMSRPLWKSSGGYIQSDKCDLDINFMSRLFALTGETSQSIADDDVFYIYRWGGSNSYHASGWGSTDGIHASKLAEGIVENQRKQGLVVQGDYTLQPRWKYDYANARNIALAAA